MNAERFEERLMHELKNHVQQRALDPHPEVAAVAGPRCRRLALRAAPLVAGAMAVAAAVAIALPPDHHRAAATRPGTVAASHSHTPAGTTAPGAVQLLDHIATVAASRPAPAVRNDQFTYVEFEEAALGVAVDAHGHVNSGLSKPLISRVWTSVDGSRPVPVQAPGRPGHPGKVSLFRMGTPTLNDPTYRLLESLPTDPDALLKKIYTVEKGHGPGPDQEAFTTIGDLLRDSIAPPRTSAALYRAAAKIPGVTVVADAVDAAGRHGIAVARTDQGERTEWIFDKTTLEFLGERSVLTQDGPEGKAGQVSAISAVLERAIVDQAGQIPQRTT
jgi:hypothetical protein